MQSENTAPSPRINIRLLFLGQKRSFWKCAQNHGLPTNIKHATKGKCKYRVIIAIVPENINKNKFLYNNWCYKLIEKFSKICLVNFSLMFCFVNWELTNKKQWFGILRFLIELGCNQSSLVNKCKNRFLQVVIGIDDLRNFLKVIEK